VNQGTGKKPRHTQNRVLFSRRRESSCTVRDVRDACDALLDAQHSPKVAGAYIRRTKIPVSNSTMSRVIIQAICNASARPLSRMQSFRFLVPLSQARSVPATTFCSPVVPARKASSSSSEKDFDINDDVPLQPPSSPNKTPLPAPNPYPEAILDIPSTGTDWSRSYAGLSTEPFPKELSEILMGPVDPMDVEIKPGSYKSQWRSSSVLC